MVKSSSPVSGGRAPASRNIRVITIGGALALALSAISLVAPAEFGLGPIAAAIARSAPASLKSLLHQRSPGRRVKGELADTKPRRHALAPQRRAVRPHQRALPKVAYAPPLPESFVRPLFGEETPFITAAARPFVPDLLFAPTPSPVAPFAPAVLFGLLPEGGGGLPGGGGTFSPTPAPVQLAAVPEPDSWALMLVGFGAAGIALRRRTRASTAPAR